MLLDASGATAITGPGSSPVDMALSENSHFLFVLNRRYGSLSAFRIAGDGSLTPLGSIDGIPATGTGLAAR